MAAKKKQAKKSTAKKTKVVARARKMAIQRSAPKAAKKPKPEVDRTAEIHALITDNYEPGKRLAWSFLNRWRVRIEEDEVLSITGAALCEAAQRFKKELGVNFKTFLFYYLRGMLLKEITRRVQEQKFRAPLIMNLHEANDDGRGALSLENLYSENVELTEALHTPEELLERKERVELCREATAELDDLEKVVLDRYFGDDESVVDIAKSLGYCRCHISRVKSKALETLSERLSIFDPNMSPADQESSSPRMKRLYRGVRGRRKSLVEKAA